MYGCVVRTSKQGEGREGAGRLKIWGYWICRNRWVLYGCVVRTRKGRVGARPMGGEGGQAGGWVGLWL